MNSPCKWILVLLSLTVKLESSFEASLGLLDLLEDGVLEQEEEEEDGMSILRSRKGSSFLEYSLFK